MLSIGEPRPRAGIRIRNCFPVGNTGAAYQQIEEAKAVCRTCKVIDACLKCALDTNQDYGVWGGLSEDERRALKRRAMRARRSQAMQMQV